MLQRGAITNREPDPESRFARRSDKRNENKSTKKESLKERDEGKNKNPNVSQQTLARRARNYAA